MTKNVDNSINLSGLQTGNCNYPSKEEQLNVINLKLEYFIETKMNKLPLHTKIWINFKDIMLKKPKQKNTRFMIPFI